MWDLLTLQLIDLMMWPAARLWPHVQASARRRRGAALAGTYAAGVLGIVAVYAGWCLLVGGAVYGGVRLAKMGLGR